MSPIMIAARTQDKQPNRNSLLVPFTTTTMIHVKGHKRIKTINKMLPYGPYPHTPLYASQHQIAHFNPPAGGPFHHPADKSGNLLIGGGRATKDRDCTISSPYTSPRSRSVEELPDQLSSLAHFLCMNLTKLYNNLHSTVYCSIHMTYQRPMMAYFLAIRPWRVCW